MDDIEAPILALIDSINRKCPKFKPTILPSKYRFKSINDLFSPKLLEKESTKHWISSLSYSYPQVAFESKLNYTLRAAELTSVKVNLG